ncbi:MAG: DUF4153 domain-containing protein [Acutalibacteraceae bacterium]
MSDYENQNVISPNGGSEIDEPINLSCYPPVLREPAVWTARDTVFALLTLVCSVFLVSLSLFGGFNLGFTVSHFTLFLLTVLYMVKSEIHIKPFPLFCGAVSLVLSAVFAIFDDSFINTLLFFAVFALYGVFAALSYTDCEKSRHGIIYSVLNALIVAPFAFLTEPFRSYGKYCSENDKKGPNKQVLVGIAISVPVLLVVIPLLISSDAAFEGLMVSLFSGIGTLIAKIILGVLLAVFLFTLLFALKKGLQRQENPLRSQTDYRNLPAATAVTLFSILSVFYAVYLFSQLAYFFSAFSGILPEGYALTPANYARRGFFELCGVCSINLGLIALITGLSRRTEEGKIPLSVRLTATLICVFSVIFTATALSKMLLYIGFYGLTRLRLLTSLFMVLLALLFVGVVIYLYLKKFPISKYIITVLAVLALAVGFLDVDRTVAHYNVENYKSDKLEEIDVSHLGGLSDSAVPYLVELLKLPDSDISEQAADELYTRAEEFYEIDTSEYGKIKLKEIKKSDFSSYNYSREQAKRLIKKNIAEIIELKPYVNEYEEYEFPPEEYYW